MTTGGGVCIVSAIQYIADTQDHFAIYLYMPLLQVWLVQLVIILCMCDYHWQLHINLTELLYSSLVNKKLSSTNSNDTVYPRLVTSQTGSHATSSPEIGFQPGVQLDCFVSQNQVRPAANRNGPKPFLTKIGTVQNRFKTFS